MAITLEEAKRLKVGDVLHHASRRNSDGSPQRWKVNGQPKIWKRKPELVKVPVKHGLRDFDYLTEENLELVFLNEDEVPMRRTVRMDAADGSYYKETIKKYARNGQVWVERIDEEIFEFSWFGPTWEKIVDLLWEEE